MMEKEFESQRPKLFGIAYRMLGIVSDVEDILQEAYIRWHNADKTNIQSTEAYLVTIVTRLCIDWLNKAKQEREAYTGPWLPEPLLSQHNLTHSLTPGPEDHRALADTLSMAFVAMLENLTPLERAVFILREAFDFKHKEIADVIDKNESHCRQLDRRARDKLHYKKAQFDYEEQSHQQLLLAFVAACANGDLDKLADLLAEDVVAYSDGGGKVIAALRPLVGRERVLRFLNRTMNYAILGNEQQQNVAIEFCQVNGQQGIKISENGQTVTVLSFMFKEGRLQALHSMRNPDKLT